MPTRVSDQIATAFALTSFALAILTGLFANVDGSTILIRSVVVLIATYTIGGLLRRAAAVVLQEHVQLTRKARPIPDPILLAKPGGDDGEIEEVEIIEDEDGV